MRSAIAKTSSSLCEMNTQATPRSRNRRSWASKVSISLRRARPWLVQHQHLRLARDGACDLDQLLLADAKVPTRVAGSSWMPQSASVAEDCA